MRTLLLVPLLFLFGCSLSPTKMSETAEINQSLLLKNASGPIVLDENTVVVDARSAFEYSVAHVPGSMRLPWEDLASPNDKYVGRPKADTTVVVKRLALMGLSPQKRVIVVGAGLGGRGEEGRVAWSLLQLGFPDVQVVGVDYFRAGLNNAEPPPRPNEPEWTAKPRAELVADRSEVLAAALTKIPEGGRQTTFLLDVRSRKEYFEKHAFGEGYSTPDLRALHVPWEQFYSAEGRPNKDIRAQLLALGIQPGDRIITLSHHGVRSGAAAFALMSMGFSNVANYATGYQELLDNPKKKRPKRYQK